jgi:hypothetical protein
MIVVERVVIVVIDQLIDRLTGSRRGAARQARS